MSKHVLRCTACARDHEDDGFRFTCASSHAPSLLRSVYEETSFLPQESSGISRYAHWLPARNRIPSTARTATFQSDALNRALGTPNLWLAFNGFWPDRGAHLEHATFKELEAAAVVARFPRDGTVLVAASAGNTATSLAAACSLAQIPAVIVVPQRAIGALRFVNPPHKCIKFIAVADGTYDDAIFFARRVAAHPGFFFEGGASNVARRDGIGTTMLAAVETLGRLPDHYVQAVGSGGGAIAAHEAALRLLATGMFGQRLPKLLLVQNEPSAPVHASWQQRSPILLGQEDPVSHRAAEQTLAAKVLGMRVPPYALPGGLYSILSESDGDTASATNEQARRSSTLFTDLEGVDIEPAAAVALAGLQNALSDGRIDRHANILLHITGGGREASLALRPCSVEPQLVVPLLATSLSRTAQAVVRLWSEGDVPAAGQFAS
ncbi:MAG: cysteate synthase [Candidatus Eremiobacteraeota bacterium]|nr:cysteate synthase [Candidatus Eremiobacteraeota bacterium]